MYNYVIISELTYKILHITLYACFYIFAIIYSSFLLKLFCTIGTIIHNFYLTYIFFTYIFTYIFIFICFNKFVIKKSMFDFFADRGVQHPVYPRTGETSRSALYGLRA